MSISKINDNAISANECNLDIYEYLEIVKSQKEYCRRFDYDMCPSVHTKLYSFEMADAANALNHMQSLLFLGLYKDQPLLNTVQRDTAMNELKYLKSFQTRFNAKHMACRSNTHDKFPINFTTREAVTIYNCLRFNKNNTNIKNKIFHAIPDQFKKAFTLEEPKNKFIRQKISNVPIGY